MRFKNEYTATLVSPSKYNPNDFTALGTAIFYVVMVATMFAFPYFANWIGLSSWLSQIAKDDFFLSMCINVLLSQALILLFGIGYSLIKRVNPISGGGYHCTFDFTQILFGCALVVGVQLCFQSLHMDFSESTSSLGQLPTIDINSINGNLFWVFLYLFMIPVLPCICEELVFRGIIMRGLSRFGGFASVVLSGIMFSLFHGNTQQLILQFLGGVAIGGCVYLTKNFVVGMAMHFFNNLFALCYGAFSGMLSLFDRFANVCTVFSVFLGLVLLFVGIYYFLKVYQISVGLKEKHVLFGKDRKPKKVLMSAQHRVQNSSIVIEDTQIKQFVKFYPDAMRFKKGKFISLNREEKSPALAVIFLCLGIVVATIAILI